MDAEHLYVEIKAFLKYAGLSFGKMSEVKVSVENNKLYLVHGRTKSEIDINEYSGD